MGLARGTMASATPSSLSWMKTYNSGRMPFGYIKGAFSSVSRGVCI